MIDEPADEETKRKLEGEREEQRQEIREQVRTHALKLVEIERKKQIRKWGFRAGPENPRSAVEWLSILGEEVGELAEECNRRHFGSRPIDGIRHEAIQTAAVALAIVEACERGHAAIPARRSRPAGLEDQLEELHDVLEGENLSQDEFRKAKRLVWKLRDSMKEGGGDQ